jgi:hypothetical protein
VFVLSSMRSGSTLLRMMLDSHSRICAPHEMHLSTWRAETNSKIAQVALDSMGFTQQELANLLWDRVLHVQLVRSGKSIVVDKTPRNTLHWHRIAATWPDARFLVLLRHPVRVAESLGAARPDIPLETHHADVERYAEALHAAQRGTTNTLTLRYEDLTTDPVATTRRITEWLGVPWEASMIDYGDHEHGGFRRGLGDWSKTIKSGAVRPPKPDPSPDEIPDGLRRSCELLGYV